MAINNDGVHKTHCCIFHGCKYGDPACPVYNREIIQDYPCEECDENSINHMMILNHYITLKEKETSIMNKNNSDLTKENNGDKVFSNLPEKKCNDMEVFLNFIHTIFQENIGNLPVVFSSTSTVPVTDSVTDYIPVPVKVKSKPIKEAYDPAIKFSYYGNNGNNNHHDGIIVIASVVNKDHKVIHYGVAYCSPNDAYVKETGKTIAYKDLIYNMTTVALSTITHNDINTRIFAGMVADDDAPSWAKDKVLFYLASHIVKVLQIKG